MTDFKSELREILDDAFQRGFHFCDDDHNDECWKNDEAYKTLDDIIALFISKGYMTGERWFGYFLQEFSGIPVNTEITINIDEIMKAAKRASGIKGEIK